MTHFCSSEISGFHPIPIDIRVPSNQHESGVARIESIGSRIQVSHSHLSTKQARCGVIFNSWRWCWCCCYCFLWIGLFFCGVEFIWFTTWQNLSSSFLWHADAVWIFDDLSMLVLLLVLVSVLISLMARQLETFNGCCFGCYYIRNLENYLPQNRWRYGNETLRTFSLYIDWDILRVVDQ